MKARMVLAAAPIRKLHVVGRSRRPAGFSLRKHPISPSLHRGLSPVGYDFALANGDELVSYTLQKPRHSAVRYYTHSNSLYSIAATTNTAGAVVERYSYNAYGVRTIHNSAGATLTKSAVSNDRGFTSYKLDSETGLYFARERMYSPKLGRFLERDPIAKRQINGVFIPSAGDGYYEGLNAYAAYFIPAMLDPTGMTACGDECSNVGSFQTNSSTDWDWIPSLSGPGYNDPNTIPDMTNTVNNANTALVIAGGLATGAQTGAVAAANGIGRLGAVGTGVTTGLVDPAVDRYLTPSPSDFPENTTPSVSRRNGNAGYDLRIKVAGLTCKKVPCVWSSGNCGCAKKLIPFDSGWRRISVGASTNQGDAGALRQALLSIIAEATAGSNACP